VQALRAGIEANHLLAQQREWPISTKLVVRQSTSPPRDNVPAPAKTKPAARRSAVKL
jgi:hypothetical protein